MPVRLLFGEGFRDVMGTGEITLELEPGGCGTAWTVGRALRRAGVDVSQLDGTGGEVPALVILNDQVLGPGERFSAPVRDGDVLRFQLMLTGG